MTTNLTWQRLLRRVFSSDRQRSSRRPAAVPPRRLGCEVLERRDVPAALVQTGTGADAATLQAVVDAFRTDLGGGDANPDSLGTFFTGRREVNWDDVPGDSASPTDLPAEFFNATLTRGLLLASPDAGATFRVSMDDDDPTDADDDQTLFTDLNAGYGTTFQTFSAERLFTTVGSNLTEVTFLIPGSSAAATVNGFGAVFVDVDDAAATTVEYLDPFGNSLGVFNVEALDDGLSFLGVSFDAGERIGRVLITSGNVIVGADDDDAGSDVVVMDDFIYGEPRALPDLIALDTATNALLRFNASAPGTILATIDLVGLSAGESLGAVDYRPATGQLFGLVVSGTDARLVTVNTTTGELTQVGTAFTVSGSDFGFDFNPTNDRIRIVSDADMNLAVNPDTGAVTQQTDLNPPDPNVVAVAYNNSVAGATTTTLFGIDSGGDQLVTQDPPADGMLTTVGALLVDTSGAAGFDIEGATNTAFAVLDVGGVSQLYTIDIATGAALLVGDIGGGVLVRGVAVVPPPRLSIGDVSIDEGNAGTVDLVFTVTLTGDVPFDQPVSLNFLTTEGTATGDADFTSVPLTLLSFPLGEITQTITVSIVGDTLDEANETFTVDLSQVTGALIADASGTGTILDDDAAPTLSISDATVTEGNAGTVEATFTVSLSSASGLAVTVSAVTADGNATDPADYTGIPPTNLTFAAGQTTQTVIVLVQGDTLDETNETFSVNLSGASNATIADGTGTGTITDDDAPPALSVNDVTVSESGTQATFVVSLSAASGQNITVAVATANGSATSPDDFTAVPTTTVTFAPGQTTQTVLVDIQNDTLDEADETFTVNLSDAANATIDDASGTGTITDDDAPPTVSIGDASVTEGDASAVPATFTVSLSAASGQTITVVAASADGTALQPGDYTALPPTTLTFAPGVTQQTVIVDTQGDLTDEPDETFIVNLSGETNVTLGDASGTGTILDNDPPPAISINDVTVTEGNAGTVNATFVISLSAASSQTITVLAATANGTAQEPGDYTALAATPVTFAPNTTQQTVIVSVVGDTLDEADETFTVGLSDATNATIADNSGTGTITDDDAPPALSISDVAVTEGNSGTTAATFVVSLSAASGLTVNVVAASAAGTAQSPADFVALAATTLTFAPGVTQQSVVVNVVGDTLDEANETFNVNLSGAVNATVADGTGVATINDDDDAPTVSINDVTVTEGNAGNVVASFTVTLSAASGQNVSVTAASADGTAQAPGDYTALGATVLNFAPGVLTQTVNVTVLGDTVDEANETFTVNLTAPTNVTLADAQGTGTIVDDDQSQDPNECLVNEVYRDLLGREADANGLAHFSGLLAAGAATRTQIALAIQGSEEYRVGAINDLYNRLLGRNVDASGQTTWLRFLASGGNLEGVASNIIGSDEYFARAGGNNTQFLEQVYRDALGREIDDSGRGSWAAFLASGQLRSTTAARILSSAESNRREVTVFVYNELLDRQPDAGGLEAFASFLDLGAATELVQALVIGSDEYFSKACGTI